MIRLKKQNVTAEIMEMGAEMRAYRTADGKNRLWSGDPAVWKGVAPILFPVIGSVKNQKVRINGKEWAVPKHGFARTSVFRVVRQSAEDCTLMMQDSPETLEVFPFAFALFVTHRLLDNGFVTEYRVENKSDEKMPFVIGGHPAFACPINEGEAFSDYQIIFDAEEEGRSQLCTANGLLEGEEILDLGADKRTLALDYDMISRRDTLVLAGLNSRGVMLRHKDTRKGFRFVFPESPVLAIWTKPHAKAPYICLEPWNGLPGFEKETGDFEDKPYHVSLSPGEIFCTSYRMETVE